MRLLFIFFISITIAKSQSLDTSFKPIFASQGIVNDIVVQPDGNILIAGYFDRYSNTAANSILRLKPDGTIDQTFNSGKGAQYTNSQPGAIIYDIELQPDGKILITGTFDSFNDVLRSGIVRLNTDGSVDLTFVPSVPTRLYNFGNGDFLQLQADGKTLYYRTSETGNKLFRLNTNGTLDASFITGAGLGFNTNTAIYGFAILSSGKIMVCGQFSTYNGFSAGNILRLNADGTPDNTFNIGTDNTIFEIRTQPDGKIILAGGFTKINNAPKFFMARIDEDGVLDNTYTGGPSSVNDIFFETNGNFLLAYGKSTVSRTDHNGIFISSYIGSSDTNDRFNRVVKLGNGKLLAGGTTNSNIGRNLIVLNDDLTVDTSWPLGTGLTISSSPRSILQLADGKILILGGFKYFNGQEKNEIVRLNSDLSIDNSFQSGLGFDNQFFFYLGQQSDGKILIHGQSTKYNNTSIQRILRLNLDGTLDNSYSISYPFINSVVLTPDDRLIAYNSSLVLGSQKFIVRFTSSGTQDPTFTPLFDAAPRLVLPIQSGKYWLSGNFKKINNTDVGILAKLNADGSLDNTFLSKLESTSSITSMTETPEGKILVSGYLGVKQSSSNNIDYFSLMRLLANGDIDVSFVPISTSTGFSQMKDGSILLKNGVNELSRLSSDGVAIKSFVKQKFDKDFSITPLTVTSFAVSGAFAKVNDQPYSSIARFTMPQVPNRPSTPTSLNATAVENNVTLNWIDNALNEDGFDIERLDGGIYKKIGETTSGITTYADKNLSFQTLYKYRIRAFNDGGFSSYSAEASVEIVTGLEEDKHITIYPNPNEGSFWITLSDELSTQEVIILNSLGKIVQKHENPPVKLLIDIQRETAGIYFIQIIDSQKPRITKILKK